MSDRILVMRQGHIEGELSRTEATQEDYAPSDRAVPEGCLGVTGRKPGLFNDIRGMKVLISGASTGIGAAAAVAFGREGAKVAIYFNKSGSAAEHRRRSS